jgi:hypothetical protein
MVKQRKPKRKKMTASLMRVVLTGMVLGPAVMLVASALLSFVALKIGNPAQNIFPLRYLGVFRRAGGLHSSAKV